MNREATKVLYMNLLPKFCGTFINLMVPSHAKIIFSKKSNPKKIPLSLGLVAAAAALLIIIADFYSLCLMLICIYEK